MSKQYWIIDTESPGENLDSFSASGPFPSVSAAEKHLRDDAAEGFASADKSLRDLNADDEWAKPVHIVEVIKTVQQVPQATIRVSLKKIKSS